MSKKLHISLIFSNLATIKTLSSNHRMYNLYTKFVKILEICKQVFGFGSGGAIPDSRDREY